MKKFKVGINARVLDTKQVRGWSRYAAELINGLLQRDIDIVLYADKTINNHLYDPKRVSFICKKGINYIHWEQVVLPKLVANTGVDILHCPTNYGLPLFAKTKKVLTIHDAIDKAFYESNKNLSQKFSVTEFKIKMLHQFSRWASDAVITVSEHAKYDLIKYYGLDENKISVVYEAADEKFSEKNIKPVEEIQKKYPNFVKNSLFYVGGYEERKNIVGLLKAYAMSSKKRPLLLAGQGSQGVQAENVYALGYVDDQDLPSLYFYSFAFIYPSFYEGFGLQAVEAMQMKKPIIASGNTSLREVIAQKQCLFDPYSVESIKQKIDWLFLEADVQQLAQASYERSKVFTWQRCIDQTLKIYEEVLAK